MTVIINSKICDNAKECNGIAVCPRSALSWDDKNKKIKINNKKCVSCGKCEKACMVGAIRVAKNEKEYIKIKKEIDSDPRKIKDLFIDRYGAQPVWATFLIPDGGFDLEVLQSDKLTCVELFSQESIQCLVRSIPIKDLIGDFDIKYRKQEVKNDDLLKKLKISKLPALLFFKKGKLLGKIEGYYSKDEKEKIKAEIHKIFN